MLPIPTYPQDLEQPVMPLDPVPESAIQDPVSDVSFQDCLLQLFSDNEPERTQSPQLTLSDDPPSQSLAGMSARLLKIHPSPIISATILSDHTNPKPLKCRYPVHHSLPWMMPY